MAWSWVLDEWMVLLTGVAGRVIVVFVVDLGLELLLMLLVLLVVRLLMMLRVKV